jgi:hypothetical protein
MGDKKKVPAPFLARWPALTYPLQPELLARARSAQRTAPLTSPLPGSAHHRLTPHGAPSLLAQATVLDMSKYMDCSVRVKFTGGREVIGVLKGCAARLRLARA